MAKTKVLNGLPFNLAQSFFSTLNYYSVGYMCDWIVNSSNELDIETIRIDILNQKITPDKLMIQPLIIYLPNLLPIIEKEILGNGFSKDLILEAVFDIKVDPNREMFCSSYVKDISGRIYSSKVYREISFNKFPVFNPETSN